VSTFPADVASLVLIDGSHEAQFSRWDALQRGPGIGDLVREVTRTLPAPMRAEYDQMLEVQAMQRVSGMKPLPDLPLAVITAMKPCPPEREWTCRDPQAMAVWRQNHDEWFARSTTALRIVSADSGHYVPIDQPGLIIDAVRFVLEQVRRSTR
jgi:pimeloyl-ACP methyl ester carboxylesterase